MNLVVLKGNIVNDLELKKHGDLSVVKFNLAVNRNKEVTDFIPVAVLGKMAENTVKYCMKGSKILLRGSLRISSYIDKENNKRYATEVLVDAYQGIEFLSSPKIEIDEEQFREVK